MTLLASDNQDTSFRTAVVHEWELSACPMSTADICQSQSGVSLAWQTAGQVFWSRLSAGSMELSPPASPEGEGTDRKHPVIAADATGLTMMAWTEGTGWNKGGALAWQVFDSAGRPTGQAGRVVDAIPVWGSAAVAAKPNEGFLLVY